MISRKQIDQLKKTKLQQLCHFLGRGMQLSSGQHFHIVDYYFLFYLIAGLSQVHVNKPVDPCEEPT